MARLAEREGVRMAEFSIIYRLGEYVAHELIRLLPPTLEEKKIGTATVLQLFTLSKSDTVVGCRVDDGTILRSRETIGDDTPRYAARLVRSGRPLWTGPILSMRHLKKEIVSAGKGMECGIILADSTLSILPGDAIECIERSLVPPSLE